MTHQRNHPYISGKPPLASVSLPRPLSHDGQHTMQDTGSLNFSDPHSDSRMVQSNRSRYESQRPPTLLVFEVSYIYWLEYHTAS
ncbi:hypothetical protein B0H10DRAFT_2033808 [Mycena sp. CBHHK59/15]|nr:hypothetical protein B0H10DRAFT_2033808 [Mycena sp. CBHHK59/15]